MNLQAVKSRLPLWGGIALLPIFALGFYLDSQRQSPAPINTSAMTIPSLHSEKPANLPAMKREHLPLAIAQPAETLPSMEVGADALEPEAARQAVFRKEGSVYEKATRLFEEEPIDVEWANGYEQSLRDMFAAHSGLMRVSVNSISCHTSMCRIEVFTPRDIDADYFTAMFYNALDNFREGTLKAEASIARRMELGMTSVYIARTGYTLGFY